MRQENSPQDLNAITQITFQDAFQIWKNRWEQYVNSRGEAEGDEFDEVLSKAIIF